jgi:molecular chaperone HscA
MLREAQVEARRLVDATESALASDGHDLLTPPERATIESALYCVADVLGQGDAASLAALRAAATALNYATNDFAARRMNSNIGRALKGVRMDAIG